MLNGTTVSIDYIIERLQSAPYHFDNVNKDDVAEFIWEVVGYIGVLEPFVDAEPAVISIENHRGLLPYNMYSIEAVREYSTGTMMHSMSDLFFNTTNDNLETDTEVITDTDPATGEEYYTTVFPENSPELFRYKTQGNYIFTAFPTGRVEVAYKAFPVDTKTGLPLLPDDAKYLRAIIAFIAERLGLGMYLRDEITERKYSLLEREYLFAVGAAKTHTIMPDKSKMQTIINRWKSPHSYYGHMDSGFKYLGSRNN